MFRVALLVGAVAVPWAVISATAGASSADALRISLAFLCGGLMLAAALLVESRRFYFDRPNRILHWQRSRILSRSGSSLLFDQITAAVTQPQMDDDNPRARRFTYRPFLITIGGPIPLSNSSSLDADDYSGLLDAVRAVVGLGAAQDAHTVADLVRAGRIVDAITLERRRAGTSLEAATTTVEAIQKELADRIPRPGRS